MREFAYQELVEATEGFSPARLIGKGSHGCVYKATMMIQDDDHNNNKNNKIQEVAIKKSSLQANSKLDNEIEILSSLHQNPHVINLLGTSQVQDSSKNTATAAAAATTTKFLVMDLMPNGSLHDLLHTTTPPPPWPKRVEIAVQIARAVRSLHDGEPPVIHRDVKSANILFDSFWNAKLADFGLAVNIENQGLDSRVDSMSQPAGTMGYLDPCYTTPSKLSTKNDVFSFGVVLLEIFSCGKVIDVSRNPASIVEWAVPLIRRRRVAEICDGRVPMPGYMEGTIMQMLHIAASCVLSDEKYRPSIAHVVAQMEDCLAQRIKFPIWTSIVILVKRRRRLARRWPSEATQHEKDGDDLGDDVLGAKKVLLREVLGVKMK